MGFLQSESLKTMKLKMLHFVVIFDFLRSDHPSVSFLQPNAEAIDKYSSSYFVVFCKDDFHFIHFLLSYKFFCLAKSTDLLHYTSSKILSAMSQKMNGCLALGNILKRIVTILKECAASYAQKLSAWLCFFPGMQKANTQ